MPDLPGAPPMLPSAAGWAPPGVDAGTAGWRFDTRKGWLAPGRTANSMGTQAMMPPQFSPAGSAGGWQALISPPGQPAPPDLLNYTPSMKRMSPVGEQAPIDQLNLSLSPLGTGEPLSTAPIAAAPDFEGMDLEEMAANLAMALGVPSLEGLGQAPPPTPNVGGGQDRRRVGVGQSAPGRPVRVDQATGIWYDEYDQETVSPAEWREAREGEVAGAVAEAAGAVTGAVGGAFSRYGSMVNPQASGPSPAAPPPPPPPQQATLPAPAQQATQAPAPGTAPSSPWPGGQEPVPESDVVAGEQRAAQEAAAQANAERQRREEEAAATAAQQQRERDEEAARRQRIGYEWREPGPPGPRTSLNPEGEPTFVTKVMTPEGEKTFQPGQDVEMYQSDGTFIGWRGPDGGVKIDPNYTARAQAAAQREFRPPTFGEVQTGPNEVTVYDTTNPNNRVVFPTRPNQQVQVAGNGLWAAITSPDGSIETRPTGMWAPMQTQDGSILSVRINPESGRMEFETGYTPSQQPQTAKIGNDIYWVQPNTEDPTAPPTVTPVIQTPVRQVVGKDLIEIKPDGEAKVIWSAPQEQTPVVVGKNVYSYNPADGTIKEIFKGQEEIKTVGHGDILVPPGLDVKIHYPGGGQDRKPVGAGQAALPPPRGPWEGESGWTPPVDPAQVVGTGHRFGDAVSVEGVHKGSDLQAYEGTPALSPVDGTVTDVTYDEQGLGLQVTIRASDGKSHKLSHLSSAGVKPGDKVEMGQPVGEVGSTGLSTGPHLDYRQMDDAGNYLNPEPDLGPLARMPRADKEGGGQDRWGDKGWDPRVGAGQAIPFGLGASFGMAPPAGAGVGTNFATGYMQPSPAGGQRPPGVGPNWTFQGGQWWAPGFGPTGGGGGYGGYGGYTGYGGYQQPGGMQGQFQQPGGGYNLYPSPTAMYQTQGGIQQQQISSQAQIQAQQIASQAQLAAAQAAAAGGVQQAQIGAAGGVQQAQIGAQAGVQQAQLQLQGQIQAADKQLQAALTNANNQLQGTRYQADASYNATLAQVNQQKQAADQQYAARIAEIESAFQQHQDRLRFDQDRLAAEEQWRANKDALDAQLAQARNELEAQMAQERNQLEAGIAQLQAELQAGLANSRNELELLMSQEQLGAQREMQTQQLGAQAGMQTQQLGFQAEQAARQEALQRELQAQALASQQGMQTQQLGFQGELEARRDLLQRELQTQAIGSQQGMQTQRLQLEAELATINDLLQRELQTQALGSQQGMQTQRLGAEAALAARQEQLQRDLAAQQIQFQIAQSALSNPWLQQLTGLAPGWGQTGGPGWTPPGWGQDRAPSGKDVGSGQDVGVGQGAQIFDPNLLPPEMGGTGGYTPPPMPSSMGEVTQVVSPDGVIRPSRGPDGVYYSQGYGYVPPASLSDRQPVTPPTATNIQQVASQNFRPASQPTSAPAQGGGMTAEALSPGQLTEAQRWGMTPQAYANAYNQLMALYNSGQGQGMTAIQIQDFFRRNGGNIPLVTPGPGTTGTTGTAGVTAPPYQVPPYQMQPGPWENQPPPTYQAPPASPLTFEAAQFTPRTFQPPPTYDMSLPPSAPLPQLTAPQVTRGWQVPTSGTSPEINASPTINIPQIQSNSALAPIQPITMPTFASTMQLPNMPTINVNRRQTDMTLPNMPEITIPQTQAAGPVIPPQPAPALVGWEEFRAYSPFERAALRTRAEMQGPGGWENYSQGLRQMWGSQGGPTQAPGMTMLSAARQTPRDQLGTSQIAETFGQAPQEYWQGEARGWAPARQASVSLVT